MYNKLYAYYTRIICKLYENQAGIIMYNYYLRIIHLSPVLKFRRVTIYTNLDAHIC